MRFETLCLSTAFPFGILRKELRITQANEVLVYPSLYRLNRRVFAELSTLDPAGDRQIERGGGTEEFFGLREYRPGESLRYIDWKHSARKGALIAREMTRPTPPRLMILLVLDGAEQAAADAAGWSHAPGNPALDSAPAETQGCGGEGNGDAPTAVEPDAAPDPAAPPDPPRSAIEIGNGQGPAAGPASAKRRKRSASRRRRHEAEAEAPAPLDAITVQERAIALTASVLCDAYQQGYQVGLMVHGPTCPLFTPRHSLLHRSRVLAALAQLDLSQSGHRPEAKGFEPAVVVDAAGGYGGGGSGAARSARLYMDARQMEHYISAPTGETVLHRNAQPGKKKHRGPLSGADASSGSK
jgi:hypothetical protein